ncbi:hypothetical protein QN345_00520 [Cryobacterium sp. 10I1]|uniref:hypothetical protein n=1 Tax=unclassified Cryobacterium TaxID=2649013 RepID=UPI002B227EF3|nr:MULTISPECIES: hypothetical protein [unclassified Cryobacterium]MEB0001610.1 hypothetical protein [Cryobacterium sp. RTC2.1]MEB0303823.1 hypothetical protein [Cryobacterium sp. 10I1]
MLQKIRKALGSVTVKPPKLALSMVTTVLDIVGAALVVTGVALICIPAGFILAGLVLVAMSWRANR